MPPSAKASAANNASSAECRRREGMTPASSIRASTSRLVIFGSLFRRGRSYFRPRSLQYRNVSEADAQMDFVRRRGRLLNEGMAIFQPPALASGDIGIHRAEPADSIDGVLAFLGQVQRDLALAGCHANIAGHELEVHFAGFVLDFHPRVARSLDAVFQLNRTHAAIAERPHEPEALGENRIDGDLVATPFRMNAHPL